MKTSQKKSVTAPHVHTRACHPHTLTIPLLGAMGGVLIIVATLMFAMSYFVSFARETESSSPLQARLGAMEARLEALESR